MFLLVSNHHLLVARAQLFWECRAGWAAAGAAAGLAVRAAGLLLEALHATLLQLKVSAHLLGDFALLGEGDLHLVDLFLKNAVAATL